jgi:dephospho-CoA kinase
MGSGKSTASQIFRTFGIPVYDSDARARILLEKDQRVRNEVVNLLGKQAYEKDQLNREYVANLVFNNHHLLNCLNNIVHPVVAADAKEWESRQTNVPFTLREAALLFESGSYLTLDAVILIKAPVEMRIRRIMSRDNLTENRVLKRLRYQWSDDMKEQFADYRDFDPFFFNS